MPTIPSIISPQFWMGTLLRDFTGWGPYEDYLFYQLVTKWKHLGCEFEKPRSEGWYFGELSDFTAHLMKGPRPIEQHPLVKKLNIRFSSSHEFTYLWYLTRPANKIVDMFDKSLKVFNSHGLSTINSVHLNVDAIAGYIPTDWDPVRRIQTRWGHGVLNGEDLFIQLVRYTYWLVNASAKSDALNINITELDGQIRKINFPKKYYPVHKRATCMTSAELYTKAQPTELELMNLAFWRDNWHKMPSQYQAPKAMPVNKKTFVPRKEKVRR